MAVETLPRSTKDQQIIHEDIRELSGCIHDSGDAIPNKTLYRHFTEFSMNHPRAIQNTVGIIYFEKMALSQNFLSVSSLY